MRKITEHSILLGPEDMVDAVMALLKVRGERQPPPQDVPASLTIEGSALVSNLEFTWREHDDA